MAQALTTAMRLEALYKSKKAADEFTKPRHIRQVQQTACSSGAADEQRELVDDEPVPVQPNDTAGPRADQPTKSARKNNGAKGAKCVAAQVRQDSGTTRECDRRENRRESDADFKQLKSQVETLTQQMSMMFTRLEAAQPGQQQRPSSTTPMQTTEPRLPTPRPGGTVYSQHHQFYCYECGGPGHIARNCERRRQSAAQDPGQPPDRVRMMHQRCTLEHQMTTRSSLEDVYG